jgi:site-specific recombinase XerD
MLYTEDMLLRDAIYDFLTHCEVGKYQSKKTVENYRHYLKRFERFAKAKTDVGDLSNEIVRDYRLFLHRMPIAGQGVTMNIKTQQYHLIALRALLKHLHKNDVKTLSPEKIELPKVPNRQVEVLSREELDRMFQSIDITKRNGPRDLALLHFLYSTGLRVSEVSKLNRKDVHLASGEFRVVGKGRKARIVFLSDTASGYLKQYLDLRSDNWNPLFVSNSNRSRVDTLSGEERRLEPQAIERIVRGIAMYAGIVKKVTPHTLRHTFATELLRNGADIRSVQEMLGHASITTTQIYTHLTNKRLREIHQQFHR